MGIIGCVRENSAKESAARSFYPHPMKAPLIPLLALGTLLALTDSGLAQNKTRVTKTDGPRNLDALIAGDDLWDTTPEKFEEKFKGLGLQWLDAGKTRARFFGKGYQLFEGDVPVLEATADFKDGKLATSSISIFNRGDSANDPVNAAAFEKQVAAIKDAISSRLGVKPVDRGKDAASAVKAIGFVWTKAPTAYLLEYSYQKEMKSMGKDFRAEFIRLRVAPAPKQQGLLSSNNNTTGNKPVAKASLASNVTKEANGDVLIKTVPMVDQGPKGYCVVATAERVFRYLGLDVDQHEMAAVADASSSGGTSPTNMVESLKKLTGRLKVHIRELQGWKYDEFQRMIADYNRAAKKNKKREVNLEKMRVIDIGEIYASFDPDSLKESRAAPGKAAYSKFQRSIVETINRGVPLMWSCELGIYPEEKRTSQTHGGHMRLIIGYNTKSGEIIFSDSWGEEHAMKRMPIDNACAMTTGLYYLEPIQ